MLEQIIPVVLAIAAAWDGWRRKIERDKLVSRETEAKGQAAVDALERRLDERLMAEAMARTEGLSRLDKTISEKTSKMEKVADTMKRDFQRNHAPALKGITGSRTRR